MELYHPAEIYAYFLGELVKHVHGLENMMRLALLKPGEIFRIGEISRGDILTTNSITNEITFNELIQRYNKMVKRDFRQFYIENIVELRELRNALAHGRIFGTQPNPPHWIYNFKNNDGTCVVVFAELMTETWLVEKTELVKEAIRKVTGYCKTVMGVEHI